MLPQKERLSRNDFNRFFSVSRRSHLPLFQLAYAPHESLHVSVVVSKKIAPRAVERNRLRRRMYDMVRRYRDAHRLTGVFIFIMKSRAREASTEELADALYSALRTLT